MASFIPSLKEKIKTRVLVAETTSFTSVDVPRSTTTYGGILSTTTKPVSQIIPRTNFMGVHKNMSS